MLGGPWSTAEEAKRAVRAARQEWVIAAGEGRFKCEEWKPMDALTRDDVVGAVSDAELRDAALLVGCEGFPVEGEVEPEVQVSGRLLLQCALTRQKERLEKLQLEFDVSVDGGAYEVLAVNGSTVRKDVLDGIREASLAGLRETSAEEPSQEQRDRWGRLGLDLWSRAYNQVLAWKDGLHLLTFDESATRHDLEGMGKDADPEEAEACRAQVKAYREAATSFGLIAPPLKMRHRVCMLWRKASKLRWKRGSVSDVGSLRVDGTMLRDAELMSSDAARQIRNLGRGGVISAAPEDRAVAMRDLTVQLQDMTYRPKTHASRRRKTRWRLAGLGVVALILSVIAVMEITYDFNSSVGLVIVACVVLLSFVSAFPWGDARDLWNLHPRRLSGALDIYEDPQAGRNVR